MADTPEGTGFTVDDAVASLLTGPADTQEDREALAPAEEAGDTEPHSDAAEAADDAATPTDDDAADAGAAAEPEAQKIRFKLPDGTEIEATPEDLSKSYLRQADYTKKTTELANQRKALEQEVASIRAERETQLQTIQAAQQLLAQQMPQEPDWASLYHSDPVEFARQKAAFDIIREKQAVFAAEQQRVQQQMHFEQMQAHQQRLEQERQLLTEHVREWKDADKFKADRAKILEAGKRWGYSEQELSQVANHRDVIVMRKAMLYDELMSKRGEVERKAAEAPRMTTPTAAQNRGNPKALEKARAVQRLAKTGSIDDAVAALLS